MAKTTTKKAKAPKTTGSRKAAPTRKAPAARASKPAAATARVKTTPIDKPLTKMQLFTALSEATGVSKKEVAAVFDSLSSIVGRHLSKKGAGQFTLPGLLKITRAEKPATKARMGRNPRTGEPMQIAAKPARTTVRLRALKGLKEMI